MLIPDIDSIIVSMKTTKLMDCQQLLLHPNPDLLAILEYACGEANKIYCGSVKK